jgi:hypothetical protein
MESDRNALSTAMSPRELMRSALRRQPTPRIPCMPQISHDTPVRLYAAQDGVDWIDGIARCIEDPSLIYDYVIRIVEDLDCDGLRLFVKGDPTKVRRRGDRLEAIDPETGDRMGTIDAQGGGYVVPDNPVPPIDSLDEARRRCKQAEEAYSDEKMAVLAQARARAPERFVASSPLGMTMNTYTTLRGREQAMIDLIDRPDFVAAAIDIQVEAAIRQAEKLLSTDIDALYIGDPSSSASLISPQHFEDFCLPAYQKFCRHFSSRDVLIYIHVCGNSEPILEMLADTGADTVEPLDPLGGVSVADAKRRIGDRVGLMGGLNILTLADGSPEQVREEAIEKCREGGPHGYALAAGDMVPPTTSLENLRTMVQVAKKSLWK